MVTLAKAWPMRAWSVMGCSALMLALSGTGCEGNACSQPMDAGQVTGWGGCIQAEPAASSEGETCCDGQGWCFHAAVLPPGQVSQLSHDACAAQDDVCVPKELAAPGYVPPTCSSIGDSEGRCLSVCLPLVARQSATLPQASCDPASRCVPCYDPLSGGLTGACELTPGDAPTKPAKVFDTCCEGLGRCVPEGTVPASQKASLQQDSCASQTDLCAPVDMVTPGYTPPSCQSIGGKPGRCISTCVPSVAKQSGTLPRATCAATSLCVPCVDPLTGQPTGAC